MGARTTKRGLAAAALAGIAMFAPPASAEITVIGETSSTSPKELIAVNATTGQPLTLPAAVSDSQADDIHPSLSPDGRRLVFLRRFQGTVRVVMVDLTTGQSADLFNGFEAAADPPTTPAFSTDGTKVITGRRLEQLDPSKPPESLQASFTATDVTRFPGGPFPHQIVRTGAPDSTAPGRTVQPTGFGGPAFAYGITHTGGTPFGSVAVEQAGTTAVVSDPSRRLANPTVSRSAGVVVFERGPVRQEPRLVFRPLSGVGTAQTVELPRLVNLPGTSLANPEFSPDGRYLAFVRIPEANTTIHTGRLFVWDTATQLLLDPDGIHQAFGFNPTGEESALAVKVSRSPVFDVRVKGGGLTLAMNEGSGKVDAGVIVQEVEGTTTVLGKPRPKVDLVGRVRFRTLRRGVRKRFDLDRRIGRRPLARGRYQMTGATFGKRGEILELGEPKLVTIR